MRIKIFIPFFICSLVFIFIAGCRKNESFYYADPDAPALDIFSNKGNNVMSCYVDGAPYESTARNTGGFLSPGNTELVIERQRTNSPLDTLTITWTIEINKNFSTERYFGLALPIPKNFVFSDLSLFNGQRLVIDSTNGYFFFGNDPYYSLFQRGKGVIYFNTAKFDSTNNGYQGLMSGLFEASINSMQISSGRFDDGITNTQVRF